MSLETTLNEIKSLSVEDRIWLVGEIWDSIADDAEHLPLTESQLRELERRIADHEADPDDGIPWDEVKAQTLKRIGH